MHGGLITSLTDTLGSLAVASKGHFMTGVSTDIGTSFTKPAGRVGDTLYGKAVVTAMGKSLAYTRVDFMDSAGTLVAYGRTSFFVVSRRFSNCTQTTPSTLASHQATGSVSALPFIPPSVLNFPALGQRGVH